MYTAYVWINGGWEAMAVTRTAFLAKWLADAGCEVMGW